MDAKGVLEFAKKHDAKILDLRFIDVPGIWQHVSYPIGELSEDSFKEGFGFDASSIRGWASIHESDMLLIPDPNTAFIDPFLHHSDARDDWRRNRSANAKALSSRSSPRGQASRGLSEIHGHCRHGLLRGRSGVLHLRQHSVRPGAAAWLLFHRFRRRPLEHGARK